MAWENKYIFTFPKKRDVVSNNQNRKKEAGWRLQLFKRNIKELGFFIKFVKC